MCGINGVFNFSMYMDYEKSIIKKMTQTMIHRGPDNDGFYTNKRVSLGFRRLSIIDIAGANQPIANEVGSVKLLCNGEIYNYKELRNMLVGKGHVFSTQGDTETIVHLYEEYGLDLVKHLRGMFAFILYDIVKDQMVVCRDHFGIKPLYYIQNEDFFACSSELKSLLLTRSKSELDVESLAYYLTYQYVPLDKTMFSGIKKLLPGHMLIVNKDGVVRERYWEADFAPENKSKDEFKDEIREVMKNSVKAHMQSDVPVGAFLSSGIDSTIITSLMSKMRDINTFSVGFEGNNNECIYAESTAKFLNTNHHKWLISKEDYFQTLDNYIWYSEEPVADPSAIALYLLSKMASEHVKVILSGEGADELFAGYRIYAEPQALKRFDLLPRPVKKGISSVVKHLPDFYGKNYLLRGTTDLRHRFLGNAKIFTDDVADVLLNVPTTYNSPFDLTHEFYDKYRHLDPVKKMQIIDFNFWMPGNILLKADKMTMAHSIELRVPFLDTEVFKVARKVPTEYSITQATTKAILRETFEDIVPANILNRPKLGFPVPLAKWLKEDQGKKCIKEIKDSGIDKYINISYVDKLYLDHFQGKSNNARKIWTIFILAKWYSRFIVRGVSS